jgi:AraC-like DNA-binding protein
MAAPRADLRMRSLLVAPLLARVREAGLDAGALVQRFGLGPAAERDPSVVLSLSTLRDLFDAGERLLGDPFLGLHIAETLPRGTFGVVEFSCETALTVHAALRRLSRYHALLNDLVVVTIHDRGDLVVVEQSIPGAPLCVGRHANELFVANLILQGRRLTGRPFLPRHASFAHPAPRDVTELVRVLGTRDLRFDQGKNEVGLEAADAGARMVTADPALGGVLADHAEQLLAARPPPRSFLDQVRAELRQHLADGQPSLEALAEALRLSPRTLQRRLGEEGTSLSEVFDALREERARALVINPARTVEELAFALGYADTRGFLRAFKRWTGTTPSHYRSR